MSAHVWSDYVLDRIREVIQRDVNNRGLARDPNDNLFTRCRDDFANACRSIAETPQPVLCIVTGFFIPHAQPPCGETDGPLGAIFLARALTSLGISATLITDLYCLGSLKRGLDACGLGSSILVKSLPPPMIYWTNSLDVTWRHLSNRMGVTHLLALERVGPGSDGRCRNMRGLDITAQNYPAHLIFEDAARRMPPLCTIGIGDGGNEIGMGKIPPEVIARGIPHGGRIACRVPTDHLIVGGVSNWGAYALAAGVALLRRQRLPVSLFDVERERELLRIMVEQGPLVDGVTAKPTVTVDGLAFDDYAEPLRRIGELLEKEQCLTCEERPGPK
jgi:hypothetical protein